MGFSTRSDFVALASPLKDRLQLYDATRPPSDQPRNDAKEPGKGLPQSFIDAMKVREEVFVKEQGGTLANELDDDDSRSFHWVVYASVGFKHTSPDASTSTSPQDEKMPSIKPEGFFDSKTASGRRPSSSSTIPVGTIRLVPPPHHPLPGNNRPPGECYIILGRLAVIKDFRKTGVGRLLIDTALAFAREHPYDLLPKEDPTKPGVSMDWKGLVLVYSPEGAQKVWRQYGFETDKDMDKWIRGGVVRVGMWREMDVREGRRKSKIWLPAVP